MNRTQLWLLWFLAAESVLGLASESHVHHGEDESLSLADRQFRKAVELRSRRDASSKQLKHAASLLKAAAGVNVVSSGSQLVENSLLPALNSTEIYPGIHVANESHADALKTLSFLYSQEGQGLPFNPRAAFELLRHAADLGDPEAQREWGLILAAGVVPPREGASHRLSFELGKRSGQHALLHLYFSAAANDSLAQLALGYRHMHGLGVEKSCRTAVLHYQAVAERVTELARDPYSSPRIERVLLSMSSRRGAAPSREQEMLHYQWFADMGYVDAQRAVGRLLSQGGAELAEKALRYFRQAAEAEDADAMAHLGHMYANGIGVTASNSTAITWFRKGSDRGSPSAQFGLGYMYLWGVGLPQDYRMAVKFLTSAAEQGHPEAWFHLGTVHLNGWGVPVSMQQAQAFFAMAAKAGHVMGQYNLAMIHLKHRGQQQCEMALERLKDVAEKGPWSIMLQDASDAFAEGRYDWALLGYLKAGEAGYELAQANVAWMLSQGYGLPIDQSASGHVEPGAEPSPAALAAIRAHQRAAQQGNIDSLLAIGDAYYYGRGVARDWPQAFQVYSAAARFRNAQACFNLGYMHEYGAGVAADLALAKRNYDKALEYLPSATAPVQAALFSLWLHSWWNRARPSLPRMLDWLWDRVYTLQEPTSATQPAGSYLPKASLDFGSLERFFEVSFWDPEGVWTDDAELWETCMLITLIGCLWMVIWRRMSLRSARRRHASRQPDPPTGGRAPDSGGAPSPPSGPQQSEAGGQAPTAQQHGQPQGESQQQQIRQPSEAEQPDAAAQGQGEGTAYLGVEAVAGCSEPVDQRKQLEEQTRRPFALGRQGNLGDVHPASQELRSCSWPESKAMAASFTDSDSCSCLCAGLDCRPDACQSNGVQNMQEVAVL